MTPALPLQLLKGTLDVLVLKALSWGPMHGFGIAGWIEQGTSGELSVEDGALYQALHRMEERGLIEGEWGITELNRRAKFYRMTRKGRAHLQSEIATWDRYARAVTGLLRTA